MEASKDNKTPNQQV